MLSEQKKTDIIYIIDTFHHTPKSDYEGLSNGIDCLKIFSKLAIILVVFLMGISFFHEYHILTILMGGLFFIANNLFKKACLFSTIKFIFEEEKAAFHNSNLKTNKTNEDENIQNIRNIVRLYLKLEQQNRLTNLNLLLK